MTHATAGIVDPAFEEVSRVLQRQVKSLGGGAAVCVYFRGRPVVDTWAGFRSGTQPWQADTMAMSFSTTKGVTATALHILADRGLLDYDDHVVRYWPEFGQAGKRTITIRHLLSHRAGLYDLRSLADRGERILDWEYMVRALERARPAHVPGQRTAYHGLTFGWLVGEIVRRVSGQEFSEFVRKEIAEPLGLEGFHIGAPPDAQARAARLSRPIGLIRKPDQARIPSLLLRWGSQLVGYPIDLQVLRTALAPADGGGIFWHPDILSPSIPAANGLFTARSLARLYAALAHGGSLDHARILSRERVHEMGRIQSRQRDRVLVIRPHWRLGYHSVFTSGGALRNAFGHFGFGGSGGWADPARGLAFAMVNNRAGGTPLGDLRILQLSAAAVRCVDRLLPRADSPELLSRMAAAG